MSLYALIWSVKDAPKKDIEEHGVLSVMADEADEAGCGVLLATETMANRAKTTSKTAQRRIDDMVDRGLLARGDQSLARRIISRADRRPVVYDLMIPYDWWSETQMARINADRAKAGKPQLAPGVPCADIDQAGVCIGCGKLHRPPIAEPSPPKRRSDVGKPRRPRAADQDGLGGGTGSTPVETAQTGHGVTGSTPVETAQTGHGVTASPERGDYKSPDPVFDPEDLKPPPPTSSSARSSQPATTEEEADNPQTGQSQDTAAAVLDAAQTLGHATPARRVRNAAQLDELAALAVAALHRGWTPADLTEAIGGDLVSARTVFGALRHRLQPEHLGDPPSGPASTAPAQRRGPCPHACTSGVVTAGSHELHCPHCRPSAHANQLVATQRNGHSVKTFDDLVRLVVGEQSLEVA